MLSLPVKIIFKLFLLLFPVLGFAQVKVPHVHDEHRNYIFIPNEGQDESQVKYSAFINGGKLFFEDHSLLFHFVDFSSIQRAHLMKEVNDGRISGHAYRMNWVGSSVPVMNGENKTREYYNFFRGNDESKWASEVYGYHSLSLNDLYPGIDVRFYTSENEQMKYDYIVHAGANASLIQWNYEGVETPSLTKEGSVLIKTSLGSVTEMRPYAYQMVKGKKKKVDCNYVIRNGIVWFEFPAGYDKKIELIIDPVLIFGSSSGSTADNFGMTATYDNAGHLYTGGTAYGPGYPTTTGAWDTIANTNGTPNITDVVLTKYEPNGTYLVYSTYLGGGTFTQGTETVHSLIVNDNDELMCFGVTSSTDFPTTSGAYDNTHDGGTNIQFQFNGVNFSGGTDLWVAKFNSTGTNLIGSTFIGGSANDGVNYKVTSGNYNSVAAYDSLTSNYGDQFRGEIMIDENDNIYIASTTRSTDFPTVGAFQSLFGGQSDAVIFKFNPTLTNLMFSSYLGGDELDAGYSVKVDGSGNIYVSGGTASANFPSTAGVLSTVYNGGKCDGYITKISPAGAILSSTFIGTASYDQVFFVEVDRFDDVYIYGQTLGTSTYPVVNVAYSNPNSGQFITKLNNNLTGIIYSTLFGNGNGNINLSPSAFLVDVCGNVYISGWGANILQAIPLNGMPTTANAFQASNGDGFNFYLAVFERNMGSLLYGTYFGGPQSQEHVDGGTSRFDKYGIVYQSVCAGCGAGGNDDFPTTPGAWSNTNNSNNCNNGVFKFDFEIAPKANFTTNFLSGCAPLTIQFTNTSTAGLPYLWDFGNGDTTSLIFNPSKTYNAPGNYQVFLIVEDSICGLKDTAELIITVYPSISITATADDYIIANGETTVLHANPSGYSYLWVPSITLNNPTLQNPTASPQVTTTYAVTATDTNGCIRSDSVTIVVTEFVCEDPFVFVPNAFTPNNDGANDVLLVRGQFITELYFAVFDRWGEKVFETTDQAKGWDGTFKGKDADPAVFDYYLKAVCLGGEEYFKKGNITLIR